MIPSVAGKNWLIKSQWIVLVYNQLKVNGSYECIIKRETKSLEKQPLEVLNLIKNKKSGEADYISSSYRRKQKVWRKYMKITNLKTNHITNPLGFDLGNPRFSFVTSDTTATRQVAAQIQVALDINFTDIVFDTGKSHEIDSLAFELPIKLKAYTRYYWWVTVWADNGEEATSAAAWFETAKIDEAWSAKWITPVLDKEIHPMLIKEFTILKEVASVRAYVCGLGLYELSLNSEKAGEEFLSPNFNAYHKWLQYQTYDLTNLVKKGQNMVEVLLGNGLYKGRFGFEGGTTEIYGDKFALLCEMILIYRDGTVETINFENSWKAKKSNILTSGLYDGEIYDATIKDTTLYETQEINLGFDRLKARLSLPVVIKEKLKPV